MDEKTAPDYLEDIGWGKYNRKVFLQCGIAWATDMIWSANVAYILEGSKEEFSLSGLEMGFLGSCFPLGLMIGTMIWGVVGDRYGRMYAFKSTVCISALFSLCLTLSINPIMTGILLFLLGSGIGGELSLGNTVFYEFCPPSKLYYLTGMAVFWAAGGTASALIALITVLTNNSGISDWRIIVGTGFIIEVFCVIFRFFLEETPAYCESSGQIDRMKNVLNNISIQNTGKEYEFDLRLRSNNKDSIVSLKNEKQQDSWTLIKKLFQQNCKLVSIFCVMYFSASFAFTSLLYFMPEFLGDLSTTMAYGIILIQQACGVPGVLLGSWMVETRFGRRYTILFPFVLAGVCCFLFYIEANVISIIVNTSIMNLLDMMGYSAIYTINPESYPTDIRNLGVSLANSFGKLSAIISPAFTGILMTMNGGFQIAITLFAILFAITGLAALLLKETRVEKKEGHLIKS